MGTRFSRFLMTMMMMGSAICSIPGLSATAAEPAVPIVIANAGFESPAAADGFVLIGSPPAWSVFNPQNITGSSDAVGVINPTGTDHFPAGAKEGRNAAVIFMDGPATGEAGLQQTILSPLQGNRRYTLQVEVGNIASGTANFGYFNLAGFPGYRIDLLAGGVLLASDNNSLAGAIPDGQFRTSTFVAAIPPSHSSEGSLLEIRLVNLNQPGTSAAPGIEVNFDDIRLTVEPSQPELAIEITSEKTIVVSWRDLAGLFVLQSTANLDSPDWHDVPQPPARANGFNQVSLSPTDAPAFLRLRASE